MNLHVHGESDGINSISVEEDCILSYDHLLRACSLFSTLSLYKLIFLLLPLYSTVALKVLCSIKKCNKKGGLKMH